MPTAVKKHRRLAKQAPAHSNGVTALSRTMADLVKELGSIKPHRILLTPTPGTATEADLIRLMESEPKRLCELVNGTLVEKTMGMNESRLAFDLGYFLKHYLMQHDIGFLTAPDGPFRISPRTIRMPDIAYLSWKHFPHRARDLDKHPVSDVVPELAIEIISKSNTRKEIENKLKEYLSAGVQLVWIIDPRKRTVAVYRADGTSEVLDHKGKLTGEVVLPGFKLEISRFL
ncbi:MAG: Uma2 family endonuclease [Planctomycetia bacterium]|nr:Uma2 family endonuclease [Planctomycetia bacterium]